MNLGTLERIDFNRLPQRVRERFVALTRAQASRESVLYSEPLYWGCLDWTKALLGVASLVLAAVYCFQSADKTETAKELAPFVVPLLVVGGTFLFKRIYLMARPPPYNEGTWVLHGYIIQCGRGVFRAMRMAPNTPMQPVTKVTIQRDRRGVERSRSVRYALRIGTGSHSVELQSLATLEQATNLQHTITSALQNHDQALRHKQWNWLQHFDPLVECTYGGTWYPGEPDPSGPRYRGWPLWASFVLPAAMAPVAFGVWALAVYLPASLEETGAEATKTVATKMERELKSEDPYLSCTTHALWKSRIIDLECDQGGRDDTMVLPYLKSHCDEFENDGIREMRVKLIKRYKVKYDYRSSQEEYTFDVDECSR